MSGQERSGFALRLEQAIRSKGWSQNRLETEAGLSIGYVSKLVGDKRGDRIELAILRAIAETLEVSLDWLVRGIEGKDYPERATVVRHARAGGVPSVVLERLYSDRYAGRADLTREGWIKALAAEQAEFVREGMRDLAEEKKAPPKAATKPKAAKRRAS